MASSVNRASYSDAVETNRTILLSMMPILIIITILGNGAYIITLAKKKSLHTPSNMLLGALAMSDLLVAIVAEPTWMIEIASYGPIIAQHLNRGMIFFFILLSFLNIVTVNIDRYTAVFYPFWYHARSTCKTHLKIAAAVLAIAIVIIVFLATIVRTMLDKAAYVYVTLVMMSLAITCYYNFKIFNFLRQQTRRVIVVSKDANDEESRKSLARRVQEKNKAAIIAIITALFVTCYMPFTIHTIIYYDKISRKESSRNLVKNWTIFFVMLNSLMNPIVYYIRVRSFRIAFKELFCRAG